MALFSQISLHDVCLCRVSLADGGLIISGKVAHPDQILPIVRYWLPYLHIVTPDDWQAKLEHKLQAYIKH